MGLAIIPSFTACSRPYSLSVNYLIVDLSKLAVPGWLLQADDVGSSLITWALTEWCVSGRVVTGVGPGDALPL